MKIGQESIPTEVKSLLDNYDPMDIIESVYHIFNWLLKRTKFVEKEYEYQELTNKYQYVLENLEIVHNEFIGPIKPRSVYHNTLNKVNDKYLLIILFYTSSFIQHLEIRTC